MKLKILFLLASFCFNTSAQDQPVRTTKDQGRISIFSGSGKSRPFSNFKAYLSYKSTNEETLRFSSSHVVKLPKGENTLSVLYENPLSGKFSIKAYLNGKTHEVIYPKTKTTNFIKPRFDKDFTVWTQFQTKGGGTIFANCASKGPWSPGGKALFVRGQMLVYDIGWLGAVQGGTRVNDGKVKTALLHSRNKKVELYLDGKLIGSRKNFWKTDPSSHVFKIAKGADDFATPLNKGKVLDLKYWTSALSDKLITDILSGHLLPSKFPESDYSMRAAKTVNGVSGMGFPEVCSSSIMS